MTELGSAQTGYPGIDQACAAVADLRSVPLTEHVQRRSQAHDQIAEHLRAAASQPSPTRPR